MTDDDIQAPDLQEWTARYGGYQNIDWERWDAAMASWREQCRHRLEVERSRS
jgi:hypothetical protein